MRRMGAGTLVGFLALVGVAAAAAGVSSERNVRDLAVLRPSATNSRTAYGSSGSLGKTGSVTSSAPYVLIDFSPSGVFNKTVDLTSPDSKFGQAGFRIAVFRLITNSSEALTLKSLGIHIDNKKINEAAVKYSMPKIDQVNACGLLNFELVVGSTSFASSTPTAKSGSGPAWTFTGTQQLASNSNNEVALWATSAVTDQNLVKLLDGCSFDMHILASEVKVQTPTKKFVKTWVNGPGATSTFVLPSVTIKAAKSNAAIVDMVWSTQTPVGAASVGEDKVISVIRVLNNTEGGSSTSTVKLKGLPMNLNATFAPKGDRVLNIYKNSVAPENLVYTKTLTAKIWRLDQKLGFYTLTTGSPLSTSVEIPAQSGTDFYVTYDTVDAGMNDTLCVSPTRTLTSFTSSLVVQFPQGTSAPSTHCLNY